MENISTCLFSLWDRTLLRQEGFSQNEISDSNDFPIETYRDCGLGEFLVISLWVYNINDDYSTENINYIVH